MNDQKNLLAELSEAERKDWEETKKAYYHSHTVLLEKYGAINFRDEGYKELVHSTPLTYDEYLDLQRTTISKCRHSFEKCFYDSWDNYFKGEIEKITSKRICFKRIYVSGMYSDGNDFSGKEDHVWMDRKGFESFKEGETVAFTAKPYCYVKTGNGKTISFGLRNAQDISKIDGYDLPTDRQLLEEQIDQIICDELCMFNKQCYMGNCIANKQWRDDIRKSMIQAVLAGKKDF